MVTPVETESSSQDNINIKSDHTKKTKYNKKFC